VRSYPGFAITSLRGEQLGTRAAIPVDMKELALTTDQAVFIDQAVPQLDDDVLMTMPLTEAKHLVAAEFERRYLVRLMGRANGSVSEGARLAGFDRTNFRRLLQRHGLR
jgi:DNA-binding protein Fis